MSLIKVYTADTAGYQEQLKDQMSNNLSQSLVNMKAQLAGNYAKIWHNVNLTPQQAFDALGADAVSLLLISTAVKNMILVLDPAYVPLVPLHALTPNQDGTVTVGA